MKKLTASVLLVVLSSSFAVVNAQQGKNDTIPSKVTQIGEVVITGALGIQRKLDSQTNPAVVISSEKMNQAASPNVLQALTAKAPNVQINTSNSGVNSSYDIQIRGARTVSGSTSPLIVIDGVISSVTIMQSIPPNLIESSTILSGTQGAAIYGPQGLNGAIILTTKKGSGKRKVNVTINSNIDFDKVAFVPARQTQYGQGWDGGRIHVENGSWGPAFNDPTIGGQMLAIGVPTYDVNGDGIISVNPNGDVPAADAAASIMGAYTPQSKDNVKSFFQTGTTLNNGVTIAAGDSAGYASLSLNRQDREFIVMDDTSKKTYGMFKAGMKKDRWTLDGTIQYSNQSVSTTDANIYRNLLQSSSETPITSFKNSLATPWGWNIYYQNPYWTIKHQRNTAKTDLMNGTINLGYKIDDHITLRNNGTVQTSSSDILNWNDGWSNGINSSVLLSPSPTAFASTLTQQNAISRYFYNDIMANFDYDLFEGLNMNATVGFNVQQTNSKVTTASGSGLKIPGLYTVWNLTTPSNPYDLNNNRSIERRNAIFANIDFSYKNYLTVNITGRNDWTSRLLNSDSSIDSKYSYFYPSVGASFLPLKAFNYKSDILSRLVVKGSWARIGNDPVSVYAIENTAILATGYPLSGNMAFLPNSNPSDYYVKPEFTNSKEVDFGFGFLKDRILLDVNLYETNTTDFISRAVSSSASGINTKLTNVGDLRNRGMEVSLSFTPIKTADFRWDATVTYSKFNQQVTDIAGGQDQVAIYEGGSVGIYAVKGEQFPVLKGTGYQRDSQGRIIINAETGDPLYTNNFIELGKVNPDYTMTFSTNLKYKNFSAYANMEYRKGGVFYSGAMSGMAFSGQLEQSASFDRTQGGYIIPNSVYLNSAGQYVENTSIKSGGDSYVGLADYYSNTYRAIAENFIVDATFFKVREMGLSYSLGKEMAKSLGLDGLTFGVYARNPFFKYAKENKGYGDPETSIGTGNLRGIAGVNQYPTVKTFGVNTTINF